MFNVDDPTARIRSTRAVDLGIKPLSLYGDRWYWNPASEAVPIVMGGVVPALRGG